jgi:hypothetical protein
MDDPPPPQRAQRKLRDQDQNGRRQPNVSKMVELPADHVKIHVREVEIEQNARDGRFLRKCESNEYLWDSLLLA